MYLNLHILTLWSDIDVIIKIAIEWNSLGQLSLLDFETSEESLIFYFSLPLLYFLLYDL